jgi:hypothetical protein
MIDNTHSLSIIRWGMQGTVLSSGMEDFFGECGSAYPRSIHRLCLRVHTRLCLLLTSCMRTCASEDSAFGFDAGPEPNGVGPGYRFPVSGCTHKDVNANVSQISAFKFFEESPLAFSGTTFPLPTKHDNLRASRVLQSKPVCSRSDSFSSCTNSLLHAVCLSVCVAWLVRGS